MLYYPAPVPALLRVYRCRVLRLDLELLNSENSDDSALLNASF